MSIFAANSARGLGYAVASVSDPIQSTLTVPLLPDGQGGRFSALVSRDGEILQVIVADTYGVLTLLQQNVSDGLWTNTPLYTPSLTVNRNFQAYTVHVDLLDAALTPLARQTILLTSSRWSEIVVNGRSVSVGPAGVPVVSDAAGTVTLLVPTEDISAATISLSNADGSPALFPTPVLIDPTFKVNQKLKTINTGDDLRNAQLQSGGSLLSDIDVSDADVDETAKAIAQLHSRLPSPQTLPLDKSTEIAEDPSKFRTKRIRRGAELGRLVAGRRTDRILASKSIKDMAWVRCSVV